MHGIPPPPADPRADAPLRDAWARRRLLICSTDQARTQPAVQRLVHALLDGAPLKSRAFAMRLYRAALYIEAV